MDSETQEAAAPSLLAPFETLFADVKAEAVKFGSALEAIADNLEAAAVADIETVFKIGAPIAVQAIIAEAPRAISGEEKFGNAVTSVEQQLESTLGPVATQDVQTLVQTTFRGLQAAVAS